ncbi:MAG: class I SAM-dependent methyltransferase [Acidobacteria bacterium]|nr:class I SAM-dependent methyltransferase [Acidobacteriota bacterium]
MQSEERLQREQNFHDSTYSNNSRAGIAKYYGITQPCWDFYRGFIWEQTPGKDVLEYGCGIGGYTIGLTKIGGRVNGIDISEVAVQTARLDAKEKGYDIPFSVMNAEQMAFADNTYDLIYGAGILHHLNLDRALSELARTLKPNGQAIFLEPLGHNPIINLYRLLTPNMRTPDEHPLTMDDLALMRRYFADVDVRYYNLMTLAFAPLGKVVRRMAFTNLLHGIDQQLFRRIPPLQRYAWNANLVLKKPRK